jgi:Hemerythrin HHE cation binding domain
MRFLQRRRILREVRLQDSRLVTAIAELRSSDSQHFASNLAEVRAMWKSHEESREESLYVLAVRLLRTGPDVTVALAAEHQLLRGVLDNLDVGTHDLTTAGRQELSALANELASHAAHEERRILRPLLRQLSYQDRKRLVENLEVGIH